MTKKEYLISKGFHWDKVWEHYVRESLDYQECISIKKDNPYIKVLCYNATWFDNDIKNLQIVFNNLKQIQEECMALPTYKRRKKALDNH